MMILLIGLFLTITALILCLVFYKDDPKPIEKKTMPPTKQMIKDLELHNKQMEEAIRYFPLQ